MAFQRGSQINPALGMVDYSPIARGGEAMARGKIAGTQAVAQGALGALDSFMSGMQKAEQNKKAEKEMLGVIKMAEKLSTGFEAIADKLDPRIAGAITEMRTAISDPNLPTYTRAAAAQTFLSQSPNIINGGMKLFDIQQEADAKKAQAQAKASEEARKRLIEELAFSSNMGNALPQNLPPEIMSEVGVRAAEQAKSMQRTERQDVDGVPYQITKFGNREIARSRIQETPRNQSPEEAAKVKAAETEATGRMNVLVEQSKADIDAGRSALRIKPGFARVAELLESGKLQTDRLAPFKTAALSVLKGLNLPIDESKLANAEEAQSYMLQSMLQQVQYTKGAVSNKEGEWFAEMGPQIGKSTEANKRIIRAINARIDLDRKVGTMVESALAKGEGYDKIQEKKQKLIAEYENALGEPTKASAGAPLTWDPATGTLR